MLFCYDELEAIITEIVHEARREALPEESDSPNNGEDTELLIRIEATATGTSRPRKEPDTIVVCP